MSANTLYRKYRPQLFGDLIGQPHVAGTLRNEIEHHQVSHAYLFSGPRGVGKTTTARLLAKAVNCQHPKAGEPDNRCDACVAIQDGKTLDVVEIDAASYTGVDNIREVIEQSRFAPSQLHMKVFIIDEVHMLSAAAFNALLKTLEEPPAHALFILATTELHRVPDTIASRCQRFNFHRLADAELAKRVRWIAQTEKRAVDDDVVDAIVRSADGSSRDAESILGQLFSLTKDRITREEADLVLPRSNEAAVTALTTAILQDSQPQALQLVQEQLALGIDLEAFRIDTLRTLRDCLLARVLPEAQRPHLNTPLLEMCAATQVEHIVLAIDALLSVSKYIATSPLPQLPLELAVMQATTLQTEQQRPQPPVELPRPQDPHPKTKTSEKHNQWQAVTKLVSAAEPSLSVPLQMVQAQQASPEKLIITSPYALHLERLQSKKGRSALTSAVTEVFGAATQIEYVHDPSLSLDVPSTIPHNTATSDTPAPTPQHPDQLWEQIVSAMK